MSGMPPHSSARWPGAADDAIDVDKRGRTSRMGAVTVVVQRALAN